MNTETDVQNACRMRAQELGAVLWRNNVGTLKDARGVPVRFGLANDSAKLNAAIKSGDLIGMTREGRFLSIECKAPGWRLTGTEHERAQQTWVWVVRNNGGLAGFATCPEHVDMILAGGHPCGV